MVYFSLDMNSRLFIKILIPVLILPLLIFPAISFGQEKNIDLGGKNPVTVYFFYGDGCPHCAEEEEFLETVPERYPNVTVKKYEIWYDGTNQKLLQEVGSAFNTRVSGVPFTVIGDELFVGYNTHETTGKLIDELIDKYSSQTYVDRVALILGGEELEKDENAPIKTGEYEDVVVPVFGKINLASFSLPTLTAIFGVVDGFNPCAMWALLFLITLLLGMKNKRRRWALGTIFILISGTSYFIFMAAWLNLFLFLGFVFWVRLIIAIIALGGGGWNIREFFKNKGAVCETTGEKQKAKIMTSLQKFVQKKNFLIAAGGLVLLAFAVNLIELVCSAGLPAIYTQILSLNDLSTLQYYLYLLLYIFFFMIDDLIVFFVAMVTLEITGASGKYVRWTRLIGGVLMVAIGTLLLFKPEWLMFG